ncbi:hypothetical protein EYC08_16695 [Tabrizicola sp. WMC-M-20]|nr:hypothetical protein EYC08_16695 [Tabrizicola sp. WMC-M-20]
MPQNFDPIFSLNGFDGQQVPFFGLTFDKEGVCTSPQSRTAVVERIRTGGFTDVIFYSHGWNNDWSDATDLYAAFLGRLGQMASRPNANLPAGIKPLMLGISWPSAAFVWPWENGPDLAALPGAHWKPSTPDLEILAEDLAEPDTRWMKDLAAADASVNATDMARIAGLLAQQFSVADPDEPAPADGFDADDLAALFSAPELRDRNESGTGSFDPAHAIDPVADGPQMAGGLVSGLFGVRKLLRLATVLKMKDRAGVVGRKGVADTVDLILSRTDARLHLVGHSYGCKVLMTALCHGPPLRPAESALLLQPAVNLLAFAPHVLGRPGGFRKALDRASKPILVTQSDNDFPLRRIFHLAVRRKSDLGEPDLASDANQWWAMGGYGPANLRQGERYELHMPAQNQPYPDFGACRVVALDATGRIGGHSDVSNDHTCWAMIQNLR